MGKEAAVCLDARCPVRDSKQIADCHTFEESQLHT
jgi:hypothetical protein